MRLQRFRFKKRERPKPRVEAYDIQPQHGSEYFADLPVNWRGWKGPKEQESFEGHVKLADSIDRLGHMSLRVSLAGDRGGSDWRVETTLFLEAGQLEGLARCARNYFG